MTKGDGFLARWSERKRDVSASEHEVVDAVVEGRNVELFADFDFGSLSFSSDYTCFMSGNVPDHVQSRALRKLWTSTDIIAQADELDDYLEDFREEAMALPAELVRSAYRIGRGFVEKSEEDEEHRRELEEAEAFTDAGSGSDKTKRSL